MKQIANILMDYGFDFDYENNNSNGEEIIAHQLGLTVSTYNGTVFFEHDGEKEESEENENTFNRLRSRTEKLLIKETSSFEDQTNKNMKQVKLFFLMALIGMISFTSCSTENSEQLQINSTEDTKGRIDRYERDGVNLPYLGEGSWYTFETINEIEYVVINGLFAKELISIVDGSCYTCRRKCFYKQNLGDNVHLVSCNDGHSYFVEDCGGTYTVYSADVQSINGHASPALPPPGC